MALTNGASYIQNPFTDMEKANFNTVSSYEVTSFYEADISGRALSSCEAILYYVEASKYKSVSTCE